MRFKAIIATTGEDAFGYSYPQAELERMAGDMPGLPVNSNGYPVGIVEAARAVPGALSVEGDIGAEAAGLYAVPVWMDLEVVGLILVPVPSDPNLTPVEMME